MKSLNKLKLTYDNIKNVLTKKYPFNEDIKKLNIVGIRSTDPVINQFDDFINYMWAEQNKNLITATCTTIPGLWYLSEDKAREYNMLLKLNPKGTAIVVPGYYPNLWTLGTLWGCEAFLQINDIKIYRQKNLDGSLHLDPTTIETGQDEGIDNHSTNEKPNMKEVDNWSAGCQTVNDIDSFNIAIAVAHQQINKTKYRLFDYYLLEEKDFD